MIPLMKPMKLLEQDDDDDDDDLSQVSRKRSVKIESDKDEDKRVAWGGDMVKKRRHGARKHKKL